MRILQLIDSLEAGGAERMAVNYANALSKIIPFSALICTRAEGSLKNELSNEVKYHFLEKRNTVDFQAIQQLRSFCISNKIELIHAHSTSFFLATIVKIIMPKIKIIWHNHNGMSHQLPSYKISIIRWASTYFAGTIVVNQQLLNWSGERLKLSNLIYLENFAVHETYLQDDLKLYGKDGIKIICLANLREEKNHLILISIAEKIISAHKNCTFHFVGKDFNDAYSRLLKEKVAATNLQDHIFFYGTQNNVFSLLQQADIGVLTSNLEGLPVALLEYGLAGLPVVVTDVGEIPNILKNTQNGFVVGSRNLEMFVTSLEKLIADEQLRVNLGRALKNTIQENYSEEAVIQKYLKWIRKC